MRHRKFFLMLSLLFLLPYVASAADSPEEAEFAQPDYRPLAGGDGQIAKPHGNLDLSSRHFAVLKAVDASRQTVTLLLDEETEPKQWPLRPGAEVLCSGYWGRLDQFVSGDRVWIWFEKDLNQKPARVALIADELTEQSLYAPFEVKSVALDDPNVATALLESTRVNTRVARTVNLTSAKMLRGDMTSDDHSLKVGEPIFVQTSGEQVRLILDPAAFEKSKVAQQQTVRQRWIDEGLPGTLIFTHPQRSEVEVMLDHEAMSWGRSLREGDRVKLRAANSIAGVVQQLRPWRERTQVLLKLDSSHMSSLEVGQRLSVQLESAPLPEDNALPALDKSTNKAERIEWVMSTIYCTCGMHDGCAGHFFTLAACDAGPGHTCGLARETRAFIAEQIDQGRSDRQIFDQLLEERGPNLVRPHMLP